MSDNATVTTVSALGNDLAGKYLTFYIGNCTYGVELVHVIEIIGIQDATSVPGVPAYIKGIINLRGRIVPVIDVRLKIGEEEKAYDERTCIIVINWQESLVGLIVDSVSEVIDFSADQLSALPEFSNVNTKKYLSSVCKTGNRLVLNLDCEKFLTDDTVSELHG
ncbi:MAG: chemotaxis protein CheW [Oscillospiraceae bacterium]|nr:chemotaxis protein CheW [Oscillospiraceae bacterium]